MQVCSGFNTTPPHSILDKPSAVKEDELAKAQARKVNAEADVVEYKAKLITNPEDVADRITPTYMGNTAGGLFIFLPF